MCGGRVGPHTGVSYDLVNFSLVTLADQDKDELHRPLPKGTKRPMAHPRG